MHELGIAINIVEVVQKHLPTDKPMRVRKIQIRAGKLAAIYPPALDTCIKAVARDTAVEGAEVVIIEEPIRALCRACQAANEFDEPPFICAMCGSMALEIQSGKDLFVESIEVEEAGPEPVGPKDENG
jgi:hydrogenase nickel incorporation protein HypA/HybF